MTEIRKREKFDQQPLSEDEEDSTQHRLLQNKEIDQLYDSYSRMKNFCESIPDQNPTEFGEVVRKYCSKASSFELTPKNVMQIMDKRIERMLKNKRIKKNWSQEDTKILLWTFSHYALKIGVTSVEQATESDWKNISDLIPGACPDGCMFKILSLKKVKLAERRWTQAEQNLLFQIATAKKKKNWRLIAQELYKRHHQRNKIFRNAKQCKQHWMCYLNPQLKKGPWDQEEDKNLMQYIFVNGGMKKWAEIAKIFRGRTQNALKNRFTLLIERLKKQKNGTNELELIEYFLTKFESSEQASRNQHTPPRQTPPIVEQSHRQSEIFEDEHVTEGRARQSPQAIQNTPQQFTMISGGLFTIPGQGQYSIIYASPQSLFWMMQDHRNDL